MLFTFLNDKVKSWSNPIDKTLIYRYDAKVVDYWPEFGANGKSELTVADVMRHEAGLSRLDTTMCQEDLTRERIKENVVGAVIEKQKQVYVLTR